MEENKVQHPEVDDEQKNSGMPVELADAHPSINDALVQFGGKVPVPTDMAKFVGFTEDQLKFLGIVWDPVFDNKWFYLYDEFIRSYLTSDKGASGPKHFNSRVLCGEGNYTKGVDYKEIDRDHELVQNYIQTYRPDLIGKTRGGALKKYYAVTGDTLEDLLMRSPAALGKQFRAFYRKVKSLARFMHMYITASAKAELLVVREEASLAKRELDAKDATITYLQQQIITATTIELNQYIYIGTNNELASKKIFKIGGVGSYDELKPRLQTYQTPNSNNDPFVFIYIAAVSDFLHVEKRIAQVLDHCRETPKSKKEMFKVGQEYIVRRVDAIVRGFAAENEAANADAELLVQCMTKPPAMAVVAAPWPDPPPNYQPQLKNAKAPKGRPKQLAIQVNATPANPQDPIAIIIAAGIDNLTDEQKREIGRQLLSRVIPDINYEQEQKIQPANVKQVIRNVTPPGHKAKIREWGKIVKAAIANTKVKLGGVW